MKTMPPFLASEVSSRLCAVDPSVAQLWSLDGFPQIEAADLRQLLMAVWMLGYSGALRDVANKTIMELPE